MIRNEIKPRIGHDLATMKGGGSQRVRERVGGGGGGREVFFWQGFPPAPLNVPDHLSTPVVDLHRFS